jgi:hypothetical protein
MHSPFAFVLTRALPAPIFISTGGGILPVPPAAGRVSKHHAARAFRARHRRADRR